MSEQTTQTEFHIHSVLDMLFSENRPLTLDEIKGLIVEKFGAAARFSSCSLTNMDCHGAVEFLLARQKITSPDNQKYSLNRGTSCGH